MSDIEQERSWEADVDEREGADVRQLIDRALGTEPDLRLRPDAVLGLAQRRERTIRVASMGGVAAAVAAATVGVALLMTEPSGSQAPVGPMVPGAGIERSENPAPTSWPRPGRPPAPSQPPPTSAPGAESAPRSQPPSSGSTAKPRPPGTTSVPTAGPTAAPPGP